MSWGGGNTILSYWLFPEFVRVTFLLIIIFFTFGITPLYSQSLLNFQWESKKALPTVSAGTLNTEDLTIAIANDEQGNIYTLSLGKGIDKRDSKGNLITANIVSANHLDSPRDLVVDEDGFIYIADYLAGGKDFRDDGKIKVFDPNGDPVPQRTILTSFYRPLGLTILGENIYVAEYYDGLQGPEKGTSLSRVRIYNKTTTAILKETNKVDIPLRIATNSEGTIYVSQAGAENPAVVILDNSLTPTGKLPNITSPGSVIVDGLDFIHVIEYGNRIRFSEFIDFENLTTDEIRKISEEISKGTSNEEFYIKSYDPSGSHVNNLLEQVDFPVDLTLVNCGKFYIDNAMMFGSYVPFFGYYPSKIEFDLEIYSRIPSIDAAQPPQISCLENIEVKLKAGETTAVVHYEEPTALDNCGVLITRTAGLASGSSFPEGQNLIEFIAKDAAGNTAICSFFIEVTGAIPPPEFMSCPENIKVSANSNKCGAEVTFDVPKASNDAGEVEVKQVSGLAPGSLFPLGENNLVFEAVDDNGNRATCSFTIAVVDEQPAELSCPSNVEHAVSFGAKTLKVYYEPPTFYDACPGAKIEQTAGLASGAEFPVGSTENVFVVTDTSGNKATCSFNVIVRESVDTEAPKIQCPRDILIPADAENCTVVADYSFPEVEETSGEVTLILVEGPARGEQVKVGLYNVRFKATDTAGNTSFCGFTITVNDTNDPVIENCPGDLNIEEKDQFILPDYSNEIIVQDCSGYQFFQEPPAGTVINESTRIQLYAEDEYGNRSPGCSFHINFSAEVMVEITSCPSNRVFSLNENCSFLLPDFRSEIKTNIAADIFQEPVPGTLINKETIVRFTALDSKGNTSSCQMTLNVEDRFAPETSCPEDITAKYDPEEGFLLPNYTSHLSIEENCGDLFIVQTPSPGSILQGDQEITFIITDPSGNSSKCNFWLYLFEDDILSVTCPGDQSVFFVNDCSYTVEDFTSKIQVNLENAVLRQDPAPGTQVFENTKVTIAATVNEKEVSCSFNIKIKDDKAPKASCVGTYLLQLNEQGIGSITPADVDNGSTDNCNIVSERLSQYNFSTADVGEKPVTLTLVDVEGNESSCETLVEVIAYSSSEIQCVDTITLELSAGRRASLNARDLYSGGTGSAQYTITKEEFSCADIGMQTIIFSYVTPTEEGTCEIVVTVQDPENFCSTSFDEPDISGPSVIITPNPGTGLVEIYTSPGITVQRAEVYDKRGRFLIFRDFNQGFSSEQVYSLDLRKYQSGVYTITLNTNEGEYIRRAIIKND